MENSQNNAKESGNNALDLEMEISQPTPPVEVGIKVFNFTRKFGLKAKSNPFPSGNQRLELVKTQN